MSVRVLLARLTQGLRWRDPRRTARLLAALARAERSSYYELLAAAKASQDAERRGAYLLHACDEARHAHMFGARALQLSAAGPEQYTRRGDYEQLFDHLGELHFLAFVHLGEQRGRRQLGLYRDELAQRGDDKTRALLDAILVDEARHEAYTREQLVRVAGSPRAAERALWWARAWEAWRSWRRLGRLVAGACFGASMQLLYFCLWPLARIERARVKR